ncbi:hypothetical protein KC345_g7013 [Hortaea werneckii]|nr:hypothetical protein KC345_g7013 [Hortaea werneckii]
MKDIRLIELQDGRIGVLTRPQGERGGRGQIGFTIIDSLEELNEQTFLEAEILQNQFVREEWGGANEAHLLSNGHVGVLGHIACFDRLGQKHYYSMVFSLNPGTFETTPVKIIAARSDFPIGPGKRPELQDVIFSGGLVRGEGGRAVLSVGVSDAEAYRIEIPDPFAEYESNLNAARKQGRIPAVLYGIGKDTLSLEVKEKELLEVLRTNPRAILQGKLTDGTTVPVVVQNIQKQSMSGKVLHIDFQHVNMSISMDSKVTIHFAGEAVGVKEGGVLQVEIYEVEVRCMPGDLPTSMEVDISGLAIGDQLLVSDLIFQSGIEVLTDPSTVMIQIKAVHDEAEEPAVTPA